MTRRVYMSHNPPRLITTKVGYDADPQVEEIGKTFDSNWFDGGGIRWIIQGNTEQNARIYFPYPLTIPPVVTPIYDRVWWDSRYQDRLYENGHGYWGNHGWPWPTQGQCNIQTTWGSTRRILGPVTTEYLTTPPYIVTNPTNNAHQRAMQPDKYIVWSM